MGVRVAFARVGAGRAAPSHAAVQLTSATATAAATDTDTDTDTIAVALASVLGLSLSVEVGQEHPERGRSRDGGKAEIGRVGDEADDADGPSPLMPVAVAHPATPPSRARPVPPLGLIALLDCTRSGIPPGRRAASAAAPALPRKRLARSFKAGSSSPSAPARLPAADGAASRRVSALPLTRGDGVALGGLLSVTANEIPNWQLELLEEGMMGTEEVDEEAWIPRADGRQPGGPQVRKRKRPRGGGAAKAKDGAAFGSTAKRMRLRIGEWGPGTWQQRVCHLLNSASQAASLEPHE